MRLPLLRRFLNHIIPATSVRLATSTSIRSLRTSAIMSSASAAAALYAAVSPIRKQEPVPENAKELAHHKQGGGFINPWDSWYEWTGPAIGRAMISRKFAGKSKSPDTTPPTVPVRQPEFLPSRQTDTLRATWLGHACYYVEFPGGFRVLFDPVFTPRCSPFSFLGPKRYTDAPCQIEDIPIIDAVVISHSHYDHLSYPAMLKIKEKHPHAHFFAGLGLKKWFNSIGIDNITELDWWDSRDIVLSTKPGSGRSSSEKKIQAADTASPPNPDEIQATIGCLPCQHMSARTPFDRNETLWASWSVNSGGRKVWFAGDTGYRTVWRELPDEDDDYDPKLDFPHCPAFKAIGDLRGPFDLGMIPIGAYAPRHIMSPMHANPFDSVNIFKDTKCQKALGMHWGTWVLTEEDVLEPPKLLKQALDRNDITDHSLFDICDIGESRLFP